MYRVPTEERGKGVALVLVALVAACTSTSSPGPVSATSLELQLRMDTRIVEGETHPVAQVRLENASKVPVAISRTFGVTNVRYLRLRIETPQGELAPYPMDVDLFETPKHICVSPGQAITWEIDLLSWYTEVGGEIDGSEPLAFTLPSGRYRIRAEYEGIPAPPGTRCPGLSGTTTSPWVEFSVGAS